jgi:hypothetical protein
LISFAPSLSSQRPGPPECLQGGKPLQHLCPSLRAPTPLQSLIGLPISVMPSGVPETAVWKFSLRACGVPQELWKNSKII